MNLRKLVPLEVHDRVRNAKREKKYFLISEWGVPYIVGKLNKRAFQQGKEHSNRIPNKGDTAPRSPGTKNREFPGVSRKCPGATPTTPRGGGGWSYRGLQKHMYGGTSPSGGEKPLLVPLELVGKPLTRIVNRKLDWVFGASTDVRAWVMSCPAPG